MRLTEPRPALTKEVEGKALGLTCLDGFFDLALHGPFDSLILFPLGKCSGQGNASTDGNQSRRCRDWSRQLGNSHSADALESLTTILDCLEQLCRCARELHYSIIGRRTMAHPH